MSFPWNKRAVPLGLLLGLGACGDDVSFQLSIEPVFSPEQEAAFADLQEWALVLEYADGGTDRYVLDFEGKSTAEVGDLEILPDGFVVAVEGYDLPSDQGGELVAFGRSQPITIGATEKVSVRVLVAQVDAFYSFEPLSTSLWGIATAPDGIGSFYTFGGCEGLSSASESIDWIKAVNVASPESAQLAFTNVTRMPEVEAGSGKVFSARCNTTATLLSKGDHAHLGQILVTGGWEVPYSAQYSMPTYEAFYFDPATATVTSAGLGSSPEGLKASRALHQAVELDSGKVVVFGGLIDNLTSIAKLEIFDPATDEFASTVGEVDFDAIWGSAAPIGSDGAIYCGGAQDFSANFGAWTATSRCVEINGSGGIALLDLPGPNLLFPAITRLDQNRVLLTGGFPNAEGDEFTIVRGQDATPQAWIYDGTIWTQAPSMQQARGGHKAATLPDGRIIVMGGAESLENVRGEGGVALACAEIFDPEASGGAGTWAPVGTCNPKTGSGPLVGTVVDPSIAVDPSYGVLLAGGFSTDGKAVPYTSIFFPAPEAE